MGGKALKVNTPRLPREKYLEVEARILDVLSSKFTHLLVPRYFNTKETFGDLDIIAYPKVDNMKSLMIELFEPVEFYSNDGTLSFAYDMKDGTYFQVDIKSVRTLDDLYMHQFYESYNDFGMIMGSLCNQWNLKFGEHGLYYALHVDNKKENPFISKVSLSKDYKKISKFMGFTEEFMNDFFLTGSGVQTKTEIEFFHNLYNSLLMTSSHILSFVEYANRTRPDRKMIQRFGDFVSMQSLRKTSSITIEDVIEYFDKSYEVKYLNLVDQVHRIARKKFLQINITEITGYERKELGTFVQNMYKYHLEFKDPLWILSTPIEDIRQKIVDFYHL